jgi:hypothetical protein
LTKLVEIRVSSFSGTLSNTREFAKQKAQEFAKQKAQEIAKQKAQEFASQNPREFAIKKRVSSQSKNAGVRHV